MPKSIWKYSRKHPILEREQTGQIFVIFNTGDMEVYKAEGELKEMLTREAYEVITTLWMIRHKGSMPRFEMTVTFYQLISNLNPWGACSNLSLFSKLIVWSLFSFLDHRCQVLAQIKRWNTSQGHTHVQRRAAITLDKRLPLSTGPATEDHHMSLSHCKIISALGPVWGQE